MNPMWRDVELAPLPPSPGTRIARRDGGSSGLGRVSAHPATPAATVAATQPAHASPARRRGTAAGLAAAIATVTADSLRATPTLVSASANSCAVPQRSAGSFWSAVRIAASAAGGTVGRLVLSGG